MQLTFTAAPPGELFNRESMRSPGGSHGLQGFPDALTPKVKRIYRKMFALTMRRGVTFGTLYTMRKWRAHSHTHTHRGTITI